MMKYFLYVIALFTFSAHSATKSYEDSIRINSTIDIVELYTQAITDVRFLPDQIELTASSDYKKFEKEVVELIIETDIPAQASGEKLRIPYTVELVTNQASCVNSNFSSQSADFSADQSINPTFVSININNVGSGSDSYTFSGVGPTNGKIATDDFFETYTSPSSSVELKKNTHQLELDFLSFYDIGSAMPSGSALNTECTGSLVFAISIGL